MRKSRYTDEQIIGFIKQADAGMSVADLCRREGFSSATFYKWRAKFGGMEASDAKRLRDLEAESQRLHCTQISIETPYRNQQLIDTILQTCRPGTRLCIAANLTGPEEFIRTRTIAEWKQLAAPNLHKQPAIFCLMS